MSEEVKRMIRRFFKNPSAVFGLVLLIFFIVVAIFAPLLAPPQIPVDPELVNIENLLKQLENNIDNENIRKELYTALKDNFDFSYGFYIDFYDYVKDLESKIKEYLKKEDQKTFNEMYGIITQLIDEYIISEEYADLTSMSKEEIKRSLKKLLKEDIKDFKNGHKAAKKFGEELSEIEKAYNNPKTFLTKAKKYFKKYYKNYIKTIDFDPYIMPIVTYDLEPQPPTKEHPFGISNGRDIYYGVIWGSRTAFKIGLIVVSIATFVGVLIGSISAYFGGWVDEVLMRITDIFMSIPFMLSAMVLTTILGTGLDKVMIAMIVFGWMGSARLIRGNILQAKEEQYVLAAKALGIPNWKIIAKHILPNTIFPVLIQASMRIGSMVIVAAALSFLGVGAPQGYADWGSILNYARDWMLGGGKNAAQYWYTVVYPGTAMVLFVLAWNLVGDALRDIFDPKLRRG